MRRFDWTRIIATLLFLPHALLALLAVINIFLTVGVMDLYGTRTKDLIIGVIILGGEILTCLALWQPGKFSSLGAMSKVRIAATIWGVMDCAWLAFLYMHAKTPSARMEMAEMLLAFVTVSALLVFGADDKKKP